MLHERVANGLGWIAMVGGVVTAGFYSMLDAVTPPLATMQPDTISTWVVIGTNAVAAISGAALIAYNAFTKARREAKAADAAMFASSWEGKFGVLQASFDILQAKLELSEGQRDFFKAQLDVIEKQNDTQIHQAEKAIAGIEGINTRLDDAVKASGDAAAH